MTGKKGGKNSKGKKQTNKEKKAKYESSTDNIQLAEQIEK